MLNGRESRCVIAAVQCIAVMLNKPQISTIKTATGSSGREAEQHLMPFIRTRMAVSQACDEVTADATGFEAQMQIRDPTPRHTHSFTQFMQFSCILKQHQPFAATLLLHFKKYLPYLAQCTGRPFWWHAVKTASSVSGVSAFLFIMDDAFFRVKIATFSSLVNCCDFCPWQV